MTISIKIRYVVFYALFFMFSLCFTLEASAQDDRLTREEIARKREAAAAEKQALPEVAKNVASFFKNSLLYKHYSVKEYSGNESAIVGNGTSAKFAIKSAQAVQNGLNYEGKVHRAGPDVYTHKIILEDVEITVRYKLNGEYQFTPTEFIGMFDVWSVSYKAGKYLYARAEAFSNGIIDQGSLEHTDAAGIVRIKGGDIDSDPQKIRIVEKIEAWGYKRIGKTNFLYESRERPAFEFFNLVPKK